MGDKNYTKDIEDRVETILAKFKTGITENTPENSVEIPPWVDTIRKLYYQFLVRQFFIST
jgi:hypothetical protein